MLMPSIRNSVFDDFFGTPFVTRTESNMMKTDIRELETSYELTIDLPGIKRENIKAELNDGYLKISAESSSRASLGCVGRSGYNVYELNEEEKGGEA